MAATILIDAREFRTGKLTGIGRVLTGLVEALIESEVAKKIFLAVFSKPAVPKTLSGHPKIKIKELPGSFIRSEFALTNLTKKNCDAFISPYPKLPFSGCFCHSINMIHDVHFITKPFYRSFIRSKIEVMRLRKALMIADLTWYVSAYSLEQTKKLAGIVGKNPKVRYSAIDSKFNNNINSSNEKFLEKYALTEGYILTIGNGSPHKNLGILLEAEKSLTRKLVFGGVTERNKRYWCMCFPQNKAVWLGHIDDNDLPKLYRNSFCTALPSTDEGFGYPPLEAMACGVPAVVSDIPSLNETTGGVAITAAYDDANAWIEAFASLEVKDFYNQQKAKSIKWVAPLIGLRSWKKHLNDIKNIIESNTCSSE